MGVRHSEYGRIPGDLYVTPRWVYESLYGVEPWARDAWDCAPINADFDFLECVSEVDAIATNPPFNLGEQFCRRGIHLAPRVAMLLPYSFDAAKSRVDLFGRPFKVRYNLTRRIRWENLEQKKAGPSQNHAWYVWDRDHNGPPMVGWLAG
jgi:hypothetical protein